MAVSADGVEDELEQPSCQDGAENSWNCWLCTSCLCRIDTKVSGALHLTEMFLWELTRTAIQAGVGGGP